MGRSAHCGQANGTRRFCASGRSSIASKRICFFGSRTERSVPITRAGWSRWFLRSTSGMVACSICSMGAMASRWVPIRAASLSIHCGPCAARWQLPPFRVHRGRGAGTPQRAPQRARSGQRSRSPERAAAHRWVALLSGSSACPHCSQTPDCPTETARRISSRPMFFAPRSGGWCCSTLAWCRTRCPALS